MGELDDFKGKISDDQFKQLQKIVSDARKDGESKGSKNKSDNDLSELDSGVESTTAKATTLGGIFDDAANAATQMLAALNPTDFSGADYLMKSGQVLANEMGIGKARMGEMRTTIADAIPEMLKLGMSTTEAFQVLKDVPTSLGVNTTMGTEALREMGAAAQVSTVNVSDLAKEFKGVGMSLYDVGNSLPYLGDYFVSLVDFREDKLEQLGL
jgi:hypothetical protein